MTIPKNLPANELSKLIEIVMSPAREILYVDTVGGNQTHRDDLWAISTEEIAQIQTLIKELLAWRNKYCLRIIGPDSKPNIDTTDDEVTWCVNCEQILNNDGDCWCKPENQLRAEQRERMG